MVEEKRATVRGEPTRYFEAGTGRAVLLVHAFPFSAEMWRPQLERVPRGWRCIAPDLRGFGASPPRALGTITMETYADDLVALMDTLGIERPVVSGLSMGGYIAFALFRRAPERIAGFVLADTRSQADSPDGLKARRALLELVRLAGVRAVADDLLPKLLGATSRRDRPQVVAEARRLVESNGAAAIEGAIHALMARPDSGPDLARIQSPTLIVVGDQDTVTPPADAAMMHAAIAGSRMVVIPQAGHLSNLETADEFSTALSGFLEDAF
jgi:3-oxoadipate enol-lactonase